MVCVCTTLLLVLLSFCLSKTVHRIIQTRTALMAGAGNRHAKTHSVKPHPAASAMHQSWKVTAAVTAAVALPQLQLPQRLAARQPCSVSDFDAAMVTLRAAYNTAPYTPSYGSVEDLAPGTVYLTGIDEGFKRNYERRPL